MKGINEAIAMYNKNGAAVASRWQRKINEVNNALRSQGMAPLSTEKSIALAKVLENTQKKLVFEASQNTMTNFGVGSFKRYAIDIVAGMVPNLIAFDTVTVNICAA